MASILSGTARVKHSSKLPAKATREQGVAMLNDHEFFLHCDPHLSKFEALTSEETPAVPDKIKEQARGETKCYRVTDIVHAIPAGLWDTNVVSTYEFTNITNGVFARIKSPLSIVMDTIWEIQAGEDGALELVEDVEINCSRLLLGVVKSQCEGGWEKIHAKMLGRLEEEGAQSASS
ncbi:hypothetical protein B0H66DRAFT_586234 [Apodospora peruviana]|uniref:DUF7053 domain-containing protein n=1 Tax=Apodospora peruviana TaxID=516989 RepID=A0AAE0IRA4_9PEZI|nr:hypothetical protein B0H66DRAFT_586234 [Apodospora peruviana]